MEKDGPADYLGRGMTNEQQRDQTIIGLRYILKSRDDEEP